MELSTLIEFWLLFSVTLFFQIAAIVIRRLFLSLIFSFIHSVLISVILIAMGHLWLAIAALWMSSGLSYFALLKTFLLIGPHNLQKPHRRITISSIFFVMIVASLTTVGAFIAPDLSTIINFSGQNAAVEILPVLVADYNIIIIVLALMALSTLISVFLLVREDEVFPRKQ